ncbi:uncharacterized protein V6R79_026410 [Siganus canaliculatus]
MGNAPASEKNVRQAQYPSEGEKQFVHERQKIVLKTLSKLGINSSADAVPRIAVLGSGGGERAAVGMLGSLYQMEKEGLLDAVLYVAGVSGSTWTMASLYRDPQWSKNINKAEARILGADVDMDAAHSWLDERLNDEFFSLSDVWGLLTSAKIMKQMEFRKMSEEASRNASNPYPVYSATEKICLNEKTEEGKWFEVTPHEAGFTDLGIFVNTSLLGSKFENGALQAKTAEMDMVQLQGILGSALADGQMNKNTIYSWLNVRSSAQGFQRAHHTVGSVIDLSRSSAIDDEELSELDNLQRIIDDQVQRNDSRWLESNTDEEIDAFAQQRTTEMLEAVRNWSDSYSARNVQRGGGTSLLERASYFKILWKIMPLLKNWEWGTTANYLYKYKDSSIPHCLHSQDRFYLIDAGLKINVPYPPFLGDRRNIDLIIAFDYSAGDVFETLTLARDYAAKVNKSFPELDEESLKEKDWPRDFYVFGGEDESDLAIVYIPLFNRNNTKDAEDFKEQMKEFSTFQRPYSMDKVQEELQVAKDNVRNTREALVAEINKAALRRRRKQGKV